MLRTLPIRLARMYRPISQMKREVKASRQIIPPYSSRRLVDGLRRSTAQCPSPGGAGAQHRTVDCARARRRASAATRRARASLLPSLSAGTQATRGRDYSENVAIGNDGRATLSASWEADLSGRLSQAAEGARTDAVAAEQAWVATRWQVAFETVSAAVQQRQASELEALATARLASAERLVLLTQRKFEAGQATGFDIERTRSGVVALRVEQEQLRRARGEATHALDVLAGQTPGASAASPTLASLAAPIGHRHAYLRTC